MRINFCDLAGKIIRNGTFSLRNIILEGEHRADGQNQDPVLRNMVCHLKGPNNRDPDTWYWGNASTNSLDAWQGPMNEHGKRPFPKKKVVLPLSRDSKRRSAN